MRSYSQDRKEQAMETRKDFGGVSVNRSADHPEAKNLPYPTRRVVGVLSSEDAAVRAVDRLKSEGVGEEQVELFLGEAGQACLHNYHHRSGFLGHLRQAAESLGTDQDQSREYEEAVKQGRVLMAVKAPDEDFVGRIREALTQSGATTIRYYGTLAIHDLS
jgi:hypothetical protein